MQIAIRPKPTVLASISKAARSCTFMGGGGSPGGADDARLGFDRHAEACLHRRGDLPRQRQQLRAGRLAVGQTQTVPAGKYAKASLESLSLWNGVKARLAESDSVRAALMLVARGETPLGIVYASDAKAEPRVRVVATFPDTSHPPIVYPVAALRDAPASAREFVRWLSSPAARAIFERRGFDVLD